jgi:kynurenine formamidase
MRAVTTPMDSPILTELLANYDVVDLSHTLQEGMPTYPTHSRYFHTLCESYWHGEIAVQYQILINEHTATHVDAPAHIIRDGHPAHVWIDELPATCLFGRAVTIDVTDVAGSAKFGPSVLERFEQQHGGIEKDDIVLFRTGWDRKWKLKPDSGPYLSDWPAPEPELAEALVKRGVRAVGSDAIALDECGNFALPVHNILLSNRILMVENLANLDRIPPFSLFIAIPLKIEGGSGSPIRPLAFVPKASA